MVYYDYAHLIRDISDFKQTIYAPVSQQNAGVCRAR